MASVERALTVLECGQTQVGRRVVRINSDGLAVGVGGLLQAAERVERHADVEC